MAKSSSFFGLRKGSTKSLTFSVLDGQQVTKDRVVYVKNPQTVAQAYQRYKLASLCNSWRMLSSICDHSFEGVAYGNKSRQKFMSLNLSGTDVIPVPKGSSVAIPFNLCISKGSLNNPFRNDLPIPLTGLVEGQGVTEEWVTAMTTNFSDLQRGDQITMVLVASQQENFAFNNAEYPITGYKVARIVLDPSSPVNVGLKYTATNKQFATSDGISIGVESMQIPNVAFDVDPTIGTWIISRQVSGSWLRSTAYLTADDLTIKNVYNDDYTKAAIATYAATATTATSTKYLNQAEPNI